MSSLVVPYPGIVGQRLLPEQLPTTVPAVGELHRHIVCSVTPGYSLRSSRDSTNRDTGAVIPTNVGIHPLGEPVTPSLKVTVNERGWC